VGCLRIVFFWFFVFCLGFVSAVLCGFGVGWILLLGWLLFCGGDWVVLFFIGFGVAVCWKCLHAMCVFFGIWIAAFFGLAWYFSWYCKWSVAGLSVLAPGGFGSVEV